MKTNTLILIFSFFNLVSFSQDYENRKLFELAERDTSKVSINVTIPTIEFTDTINIPEFIIEMKYSIMVELHYVDNQNYLKSNELDTLYIATYNKDQWVGVDPKYAEKPCYKKPDSCGILLAETGIYLIRFRYGTKTKTYKLTVKE